MNRIERFEGKEVEREERKIGEERGEKKRERANLVLELVTRKRRMRME